MLAAGLASFASGLVLTPAVRAAARRLGVVAVPRADRWHERPTALMGGVAIYAAFAVGLAFDPVSFLPAFPVVMAATFLFALGLIDDIEPVRPFVKLCGQVVAACWVVAYGLRLPWTGSPAADGAITIVWLVGITNALNLLDNMDGLAAGIAAIAGVFLGIAFFLNGQHALAVVPAVLCGAALGFLVFNFKPATIFMGDCGAMFLGFVLGGVALLSEYGRSRNVGAVVLTPVLILAIPILDTTLVTVTRRLAGRPVSQGGRDHTSHRLVALGASERRAVVLLYLVAALCGTFALAMRWLALDTLVGLLPAFGVLVVVFALYLGTVRVGEAPRGDDRRARPSLLHPLLDAVLVFVAWYGAFLFRFDWALPPDQREIIVDTAPLVVAVEIAALAAGGVYRELWRYARVEDVLLIVRASLTGAAAAGIAVFLLYGGAGPSRGALVLHPILLIVLVAASRLAYRLLDVLVQGKQPSVPGARPVLIYGASAGGARLLRELRENHGGTYLPIGFVDDDAKKRGRRVQGLRIFGRAEVPGVVRDHAVHDIILAEPGNDEAWLAELPGVFLRRSTLRFE